MIRRPKTKVKSKKRKNPSDASILITTRITPIGNKFKLAAYFGNNEVYTSKDKFNSYSDANLAAIAAKKVLVEELEQFSKKKRQNPKTIFELAPDESAILSDAMGIPDDKVKAFQLGRLYGIKVSLKNYCGALNWFERRKAQKAVDEGISGAFDKVAGKASLRSQGFEGPMPFIKVSNK